MFFKQSFFLIIYSVNNVVVIPYNKHNIFSGHSQLISLLEKSRDIVGDCYETKGLNLGPIWHLNNDSIEITIKVAFKESTLFWSWEQRILANAWRILLSVHFWSNENWLLKLVVNFRRVHLINLGLPVVETRRGNKLIEWLFQFVVLLKDLLGMRMFRNKVKIFDSTLCLINSNYQTLGPDSKTSIVWMREWHWWMYLGVELKGFLNLIDFISK